MFLAPRPFVWDPVSRSAHPGGAELYSASCALMAMGTDRSAAIDLEGGGFDALSAVEAKGRVQLGAPGKEPTRPRWLVGDSRVLPTRNVEEPCFS